MTSRPIVTLARATGCLASLALLSACAGGQHISATQEAEHYEREARRNYVAPGPAADPWKPYIEEAAARYDVPERWIREVMRVESGGRTEMNGMPITSGAGAMGLMQVMPATYDELRGRYGLGGDPYDPHNSILAGTAYIRELYDLYGSPGFLAAYNGGPGRLDDYLTRDRPLADETRRYVAKIGPYIADSFPNKRSTAETYAMNSLPSSIPAGPRYSPPPSQTAAYVPPETAASQTAAYVPPPPVAPLPLAPAPVAPAAPVAAAPVEVAYAPPASSDDAFDPPPGWHPASAPSEAAAYTPPAPPAYVPRPYVPPAPYVPLPAPPRPPRAPVEIAALPEPPLPVAPASRVQTASAYEPAQQGSSRHEGFRLVAPAMAAPAPAFRGSPGQWAIQVGAFGNEGLAHIAVGQAREEAGAVLAAARPAVASVREPHGTLYRARLTGLSRESASQACERLRGRTNCIVLSPNAQD